MAATQRPTPRKQPARAGPHRQFSPPIATYRSLLQPQPTRGPSGGALCAAAQRSPEPTGPNPRRLAGAIAALHLDEPGPLPEIDRLTALTQTPGSSEISPKKAASVSTGVRRSRSRDRCRRDAARLWLLETWARSALHRRDPAGAASRGKMLSSKTCPRGSLQANTQGRRHLRE